VGPFPKEGLVRLNDEIHSHMRGFINVVDCSPKGREQSIKDGQKEMRASLETAGEYVGDDNRTEDSSNKTGTSTDKINASVHQTNGLLVSTFDSAYGQVRVNLPGDMRAGDTISGTVVAEPRGNTEEERSENLAELRGYVVEIRGEEQLRSPSVQDPAKLKAPQATTYGPAQTIIFLTPEEAVGDKRVQDPSARESYVFSSGNGYAGNFTLGPFGEYPLVLKVSLKKAPPAAKPPAQVQRQTGAGSSSWPVIATTIVPTLEMHVTTPLNDRGFDFPAIGQQGREAEIFGPFDGNASNTTLMYGPARSTMQDFEKNTENVSGGFGLIQPLAESPRKCVFQAPTTIAGPVQLYLKEGKLETMAPGNFLGLNLSGKTDLLKNEHTDLKIDLFGLYGIPKPVPVTVVAEGVIRLDGGNYQQFMIQPSEVDRQGHYIRTLGGVGVEVGAWSATATVAKDKFNFCLQDDNNPMRTVLFNSFTGDYVFYCQNCNAGSKPVVLPWIGQTRSALMQSSDLYVTNPTVTIKPCVIILEHNVADRRVRAQIDTCTHTGGASVQTVSPKMKFTITDRNVTDNTCPPSPPN
jgi:hypothetical protein